MKLFWPRNEGFEQAFEQLQNSKLSEPFSQEVLSFIQSVSNRLVRMRHLPEVVALGYWLRKANILHIKQQFERETEEKILRARGIVFHIAPSNVDTMFVYSWMLSLLAGNKNVIRLSSKAEMNELLQVILEELPYFTQIACQTILCTYAHEEQISEIVSANCHTRVIWGGDATIQTVRRITLAPLANELAFPDRFSLAVLNSKRIEDLTNEKLDQLVEQFYNDVFWFDQMACSSPRLVVWVGRPVERFWQRFEQKIQKKQYELLAATQVIKYTTSLQLATESYVRKIAPTTYFSRVWLEDVPRNVRDLHCGGGLFYEYEIQKLAQLAHILVDKDQTLSYFGFERQQFVDFVRKIPTRGIDRIVPIGQALEFNATWDGQNFLRSFTREIVIK